MRNDFLEGLNIIEKFRAKNRKDRRRFYFWYNDIVQQILPVEIIRIKNIDDEECEDRYNVMVRYQVYGDDTWYNSLVYAGDLFNSRKELQEVVIARKLEAIEKINHDVRCDMWHKSEYNAVVGCYVSPDEVKESLWKDIEILRNI